ncbi:enoyl-CoA hydratase/isomerase family protein [Bacteroidota bacterium]
MEFLNINKEGGIATVTLQRGKVNPLNEELVDQLQQAFENLKSDEEIKVIVLTGNEKFFSFGFDIPGFMDHSKEEFRTYLSKFTKFYTYLFLYPKPVIAAINGHAIAGGCMIASACDHKIMAQGKAKISLNEITFGSTVFAGSVEMLKFAVGTKYAEEILYTGKMYTAEEAYKINLVDEIITEEYFEEHVKSIAAEFLKKDSAAFYNIKKLLRKPVYEEMIEREEESIDEFIEIWCSPGTRDKLKEIKIHS